MALSVSDYGREFADEKRSEAARRGSVTRENRQKARIAWERAFEREHGRMPSGREVASAIEKIKREVVR